MLTSETSAVHLDTIAQIALTVRDLAESRAFYEKTLGMKLLFDAGQMVFFQCGSIRLMIGLPEKPLAPEGTILYFKVTNIQDTTSSLKAKGVIFIQEPHLVAKMPDHDLWLAAFKDPTGNVIELMSEVARAA
jgi:methylmalonyl-CoA/ethylmalonyl-CoA epimerase